MLSNETVDQVKQIEDIVGIIGDYVSLKRKGQNYVGLCPFHSEKTPSFVVSPQKKIFHCFGCHESGDHISFVMKVDNLSFVEAIKEIAKKFNIPVEEVDRPLTEFDKLRANIQSVLVEVRTIFEQALPGSPAEAYLKKRGVNDESIEAFHLGYEPDNGTLWESLKRKGHSPDILVQTGLFFKTKSGDYGSRFRGRVIFPIMDHMGRTLGFSGRIISENDQAAKYVNSEESTLFNKRKLFYGLNLAKPAIRKQQKAIIVEGNLDVILSHQYGFKNTIASMGTALTRDHAMKLSRFCNEVMLGLDSDTAGQDSVERYYTLLKEENFKVRILVLPEKDPADILTQDGAMVFNDCIEKAIPFIDFKFERVLSVYDLSKGDNLPDIINAIIPALRSEPDPLVQKFFAQKIANTLKVDEEFIVAKIKNIGYNDRHNFTSKKILSKNKYEKAEENLIFLIASNLDLRRKILDEIKGASSFITPEYKELVKIIETRQEVEKGLLDILPSKEHQKVLSRILIEGDVSYPIKDGSQNWKDLVETLKRFEVERSIEQIKKDIKEAEDKGAFDEVQTLLIKLQELLVKK